MKRLFSLSLSLLFAQALLSQAASDAIRYSYLNPGGTARFLGAGGAFGALGADFGTLSTNPAGLALFRRSEFVLTPALHFGRSCSTLRGASNVENEDDKSNFNFNNLGVVFFTEPRASRWRSFNVGLGYNKLANFHNAAFYEGKSKGSIMNGFFAEAEQVLGGGGSSEDLYPFGAGLALDANAIYYQNGLLTYDFDSTRAATLARDQSLVTTGGINEMVVSFAGNYNDELMIGATIGVPFVKYELQGDYTEADPADAVPYFDDLRYTEYLRTNGVGVNLKLGVIYRPTKMLRFGAAFHSPTLMSLTDNYETTFRYAYTDGGGSNPGQNVYSPSGTTDYRLRTSWRAILSGAVLVNKHGFLSADVEWVDYSTNRFNLTADIASSDNQTAERELNNEIRRAYKQAMNLRFGGELALDALRLRAGTSLLGKPGNTQNGFDVAFSGGIGLRLQSFYLDFGFRRAVGKSTVQPYSDPEVSPDDQPIADLKSRATDVLLTAGFKF